jgi:hypothetical protein
MKTKFTIMLTVGLLFAAAATQAQTPFADRRDIRHDRVEVRNDRRDLRFDRHDLYRDRRDLRFDRFDRRCF